MFFSNDMRIKKWDKVFKSGPRNMSKKTSFVVAKYLFNFPKTA